MTRRRSGCDQFATFDTLVFESTVRFVDYAHQAVVRTQVNAAIVHDGLFPVKATGSSLEEETTWKRLDGGKSDLKLSGRLIGGCLDTIPRLAGTRFGTIPQFVEQSGADGTLLYLENAEMKPCDVARSLLGLRFCGWFEGLAGILIGRNAGPDSTQPAELSYVEALQSALADIHCPVIYDMDIGHVPPQLSFVNGALAQVELRDGLGTVVQWLEGGRNKPCIECPQLRNPDGPSGVAQRHSGRLSERLAYEKIRLLRATRYIGSVCALPYSVCPLRPGEQLRAMTWTCFVRPGSITCKTAVARHALQL